MPKQKSEPVEELDETVIPEQVDGLEEDTQGDAAKPHSKKHLWITGGTIFAVVLAFLFFVTQPSPTQTGSSTPTPIAANPLNVNQAVIPIAATTASTTSSSPGGQSVFTSGGSGASGGAGGAGGAAGRSATSSFTTDNYFNSYVTKVASENPTPTPTPSPKVLGATCGSGATWIGTTSFAWATASNWVDNRVPCSTDDVVIPASTTRQPTLDLASGSVTINSLNITGISGTPETLTVSNGSATNQLITTADVTVNAYGKVTHTVNTTAQTHILSMSVGGNLTVSANGSIDVSNSGFSSGGPGAGAGTGGSIYGGGGYGGYGGVNTYGGAPYGSVTQPTNIGSNSYSGVRGGGAVRLAVGGTFTNNNTTAGVLANGNNGTNGAGSGGSIWISANAFAGTGKIAANGGNSTSGTYTSGGGGGGRIALYSTTSSISGSQTASGGTSASGVNYAGGGGTIYTFDSGSVNGNLTIGAAGANYATLRPTPQLGATETYDTFAISDLASYTIPSSSILTATTFNLSTATVDYLVNAGTINGNGTTSAINAANLKLTNTGAISGVVGITVGTLTNAAGTISGVATLAATTAAIAAFTNTGTISGVTSLTTPAIAGVVNAGTISGSYPLTTAFNFINNGSLIGVTALTVNAGTFINNGALGSGNGPALTVNGSAAIFESDTTTPSTALNLSSLSITAGGRVYHKANPAGATQVYALNLNVSGNVTIDSTSSIDVSGKGFTTGYGPGAGTLSGTTYGGGGYGGYGGNIIYGGAPYGSVTQPTDLGSGGQAGAGGGAVKLIIGGTFTNNNTTAGVNASSLTGSAASGGSGGSVWISANAFSGSGAVIANGGSPTSVTNIYCAGGGGRIALYTTTGSLSGTQAASGGSSASGVSYAGGGGTIYTFDSSSVNGNLTIGAAGANYPSLRSTPQSSTSETYDAFAINSNYTSYTVPSGYTLTATTFNLSAATLDYLVNNGTINGMSALNAASLNLNNSGSIPNLSSVNIQTFTNSATLSNLTSVTVSGVLTNSATGNLSGNLAINAGTLTNNGAITGTSVTAATLTNANGATISSPTLSTTASFTNSGSISDVTSLSITGATRTNNSTGTIAGSYTLAVPSGTFSNNGSLSGATSISITAGGNLVNGGGALGSGNGADLTINGGTYTANGTNTTVNLASLTVTNGGNVTASNLSRLNLNISGNASIDSTSTVNLNGKGNGSNGGTGHGGSDYDAGGGGYGSSGGNGYSTGVGCSSSYTNGGITYGSSSAPTDFGSGGGSADYHGPGGAGGGAVKLVVAGTLNVAGAVTANGARGSGNASYAIGGSGSGGSIWLTAGAITGAGSITATGGSLVSVTSGSCTYYAGAGGGGRIALYTSATSTASSVTPSSGSYTGGDSVIITGTGFLPSNTVKFGGTSATGVTYINPTTIYATTPAHGYGPVNVDVTVPAFPGTISAGAGSLVNSSSVTSTLANGYVYTMSLSKFAFAPTSTTAIAGSPTSSLAITAQDTYGNAVNVGSPTVMTLTDGGAGGQFSLTSSPFTPTATATITTGTSSVVVYYQNATTGTYTLNAHNDSYTDATASITITSASIASFYYFVAPASGTAGAASTVFTVGAKDSFGNVIIVTSNTTVYLYSTSGTGTFSTTSGGPYNITSVVIPNGSATADFYYKDNTAGSYTLTGSDQSPLDSPDTGLTNATTAYTVNATTLAKFTFSPTTTTVADVATPALVITARDVFNNPVNVGSPLVLTLSDGDAGQFSLTSSPFTPTPTATITTGTSSVTVYYRNTTTGTYTLNAHNNSYTDATASVTIVPAAIASFYYATAPASGAAGSASTVFTVGAKDEFGNIVIVSTNTTVYLYSTSGTGTFSTTSGGTYTSALSITIPNGSATADFYYKDVTAGSYTLTGSEQSPLDSPDTGLTNATTAYTVNVGSLAKFTFSPASVTATAGASTSALTITARDAFNNPVNVASPTIMTLTDGGGGGQYSLTSIPFTPTATATIGTGSSTVVVYYQNNAIGTYTLNAHNDSYTDATASANITLAPTPTPTPTPPTSGQTHQLTGRGVTLGTSTPSDNTADFQWHSAVNNTIRSIRIQLCTTPLKNDPCTTPSGASMSSTTLTSTGGQLGTGWSYAINSNQDVLLIKAAGAAVTVGGLQTVSLDGFINPSTYGTFFFRITTYSDVSGAANYSLEYGAVATSTAKSITTSANVGESLIFRVANTVSANCTSQTDVADPNNTTEDLVTLSPASLSLTNPSVATAQFCASTNAQYGYVISYHDEALGGPTKGFWNGAHEFGTLPSSPNGSGTFTQFTSTPGTEQFGFNLRDNVTFGFDPDGNGLVADLLNPDYATVNRFSYDDSGASIPLAQKTSPNAAAARYTISYLANINPLTPGGTYQAHQVFVIVATY